ncbi:unnamed protein product, partial [marine sediment metagenome]
MEERFAAVVQIDIVHIVPCLIYDFPEEVEML